MKVQFIPGVTEEICIPIIEKISGKKYNCKKFKNSFYSGYSPERINPGDKKYNRFNNQSYKWM